jgi:arylsulfatase
MAADDRPNILFFLPDQHRPDFLGLNPTLPVRTPHIDALAREGTRFVNAITPSPLCAPARACLASGRAYADCGVRDNQDDYPLDLPTHYAALRDAGYYVAGVGKFDLHKNTHDWGLDGARLLPEWGFTEGIDNEGKLDAVHSGAALPKGPYMAYLHERGLAEAHVRDFRDRRHVQEVNGRRVVEFDTFPTPLPEEAYCDNWIAENGLRLLRDFPRDRPWHLVVNFTGPHSPWDVTPAMYERWRNVDFPPPHANETGNAAPHQQVRRNYAAMIENIDRHVGRFLAAVEDRGERDRTLLVYSSDHGEMLGDHGLWGKQTYYQASVGIPLVIAGPGVRRGATSTALVPLHDVAATFLDYAGAPPLPAIDARSLRAVLTGQRADHRPVAVSALLNWRLAFDGRYKLVQEQAASPRLFDLWHDPNEDTNIAAQSTADVTRLTQALAHTGTPASAS